MESTNRYVVTDIHGQLPLFQYGLERIHFIQGKDHLTVIGDAIDRGRDGIKLLLFLMEHPDSFDLIPGNHEFMMLNSVDPNGGIGLDGPSARIWIEANGGDATYNQYLNLLERERIALLDYLNSRLMAKTIMVRRFDGDCLPFVLTHSGYDERFDGITYKDAMEKYGFDAISDHVWNSIYRRGDTAGEDIYYKTVEGKRAQFVTGHVPVQNIRMFLHDDKNFDNFSPVYLEDRMISIDGGAAWGPQRGMCTGLIFYNLTTGEIIPISFYEMRKGYKGN